MIIKGRWIRAKDSLLNWDASMLVIYRSSKLFNDVYYPLKRLESELT